MNWRRNAGVGFGYELDTLANGETNELVRAFIDLFSPDQTGSMIGYLANWIPLLRWIVSVSRVPFDTIAQAETVSLTFKLAHST